MNGLNKVKKQLYINNGFGLLGILICSTPIEFTDKKEIPTARTNGEKIEININFWNTLTLDDKMFLIAHEIGHIILLHSIRAKSVSCLKTWNEAGDYVINNNLLYENNGKFKVNQLKPLTNKKYLNWTTEQVYNDLLKNKSSQNNNNDNINELNSIGLDIKKSSGEDLNKQDKNTILKVNVAKSMSNKLTNSSSGSNYGSLTGELTEILNKFLKPKIKWNKLLLKYLTELNRQNRSFKRPSKKSNSDFILPSYIKSDKLTTINFYLDTSASISEKEIKVFNSEIKLIKKLFNPEEFNIIQFDTKIKNILNVKKTNKLNSINITGRGGTSLKEVYKHIENTKPKLAIVMSDFDVMIPKTKFKNVIWICSDPNNKTNLPKCGKVIHINPYKY